MRDYQVKVGKETFALRYFSGVPQLWVWSQYSNETIKVDGKGTIFHEYGEDDRASTIRAALPTIKQRTRLPVKIRKALQGIDLGD